MILLKTSMKELPQNCMECHIEWCRKPAKENKYEIEVKKIL